MQAVAKSQKIKKSTSTKVFYVICYVFVALMALVCLLPFIMVVSGSFSSEQAIRFQGYGILPRNFTTAAYTLIFKNPMTVVRAYGVSIFITLAGTALGLLLTTMTAYVISRKDFKYRNALSFFFYFTTLFNGGMVCTYIFYIQYLHLKDSYLALILPGVFNVFYLLIMRTFVSAIPTALIGVVGKQLVAAASNTLLIPGICLLMTGVLLLIADNSPEGRKLPKEITCKNGILIGIAQGLSTLPGLSRSGTTITACLLCGMDRRFAVKYSFILSIPAVLGAAVLEIKDAAAESVTAGTLGVYLAGMVVAAVVGYICIKALLIVVRGKKFKYFSWYCFAAGLLAIAGHFLI